MTGRLLCASVFALSLCPAQEGELATFGTTVVVPGGLTGKIYAIREESTKLPKFEKLEPIGTIYAKGVYIPARDFYEGFPGVTDRVEWFAIDFTGRFYIDDPGQYRFQLYSDDGSKLYIDGKTVIDNDGVHPTAGLEKPIMLSGGIHTIRLSYFQGPRFQLSLMLSVAGPGQTKFRPFNTDRFKPPANPADWKYGSPEPIPATAPNPDIGRRKLKDGLGREGPMVTLSVQVLSQGKPVRGLKKSDFAVRDNGSLQDLAEFGFHDQPLDIFLLVDGSAAMEPFYDRVKAGLASALSALGPNDRVGVVQFREQPWLQLNLTAIREMTRAAVRKLQAGAGAKDLNGAIALTALELEKRARPDVARAMVIVTDEQGPSTIPAQLTRDALWRSRVTLSGALTSEAAAGDVRQFTDASGGESFVMDERNTGLTEIFRGLRDRYRMGYPAPGGPAKSFRTVAVELTPQAKAKLQDVTVRVAGGYMVQP